VDSTNRTFLIIQTLEKVKSTTAGRNIHLLFGLPLGSLSCACAHMEDLKLLPRMKKSYVFIIFKNIVGTSEQYGEYVVVLTVATVVIVVFSCLFFDAGRAGLSNGIAWHRLHLLQRTICLCRNSYDQSGSYEVH
jgi:hypothetical protein